MCMAADVRCLRAHKPPCCYGEPKTKNKQRNITSYYKTHTHPNRMRIACARYVVRTIIIDAVDALRSHNTNNQRLHIRCCWKLTSKWTLKLFRTVDCDRMQFYHNYSSNESEVWKRAKNGRWKPTDEPNQFNPITSVSFWLFLLRKRQFFART